MTPAARGPNLVGMQADRTLFDVARRFVLRPWLALLLPLPLIACGEASSTSSPSHSSSDHPGFPLELHGTDGSVTVLDAPARRVLPGNSSAFDLVVAVAGPDRVGAFVEGARRWSVSCQREGVELAEERLIAKLDMESVVISGVDLIVTHAWQVTEQRPLLERAGVPVLEIPEVLGRAELREVFDQIGRALDEREAARGVLEDCLARLDKLESRDRSHWKVMNLSYGGNGGWSAGTGTTVDTVLRWSGARNAMGDGGRTGHLSIDLETLLEVDPDALLIGEGDDGSGGSTLAFLRQDPRVQGLRAVQLGRLIQLPGTLYGTASHHLVEAAELVALQLDVWDAEAE